ncbi:hypothetical protein IFM89_033735, partial [Coptis chinensis]
TAEYGEVAEGEGVVATTTEEASLTGGIDSRAIVPYEGGTHVLSTLSVGTEGPYVGAINSLAGANASLQGSIEDVTIKSISKTRNTEGFSNPEAAPLDVSGGRFAILQNTPEDLVMQSRVDHPLGKPRQMPEVEIDVKARTEGESGAAKTLCTPFEEDQPEMPEVFTLSSHFTLVYCLQEHYALPQESLQRSGHIGVGAASRSRHSPRKLTVAFALLSFSCSEQVILPTIAYKLFLKNISETNSVGLRGNTLKQTTELELACSQEVGHPRSPGKNLKSSRGVPKRLELQVRVCVLYSG